MTPRESPTRNVRVQDLLGWLVPVYAFVWAGSALVVSVANRRLGDALMSVVGLAVAGGLALGLLRRRERWLRSERGQQEEVS